MRTKLDTFIYILNISLVHKNSITRHILVDWLYHAWLVPSHVFVWWGVSILTLFLGYWNRYNLVLFSFYFMASNGVLKILVLECFRGIVSIYTHTVNSLHWIIYYCNYKRTLSCIIRQRAGRWFSPVPSTNKIDRHDITEMLLNVALSTITLTLYDRESLIFCWIWCHFFEFILYVLFLWWTFCSIVTCLRCIYHITYICHYYLHIDVIITYISMSILLTYLCHYYFHVYVIITFMSMSLLLTYLCHYYLHIYVIITYMSEGSGGSVS